MWWSWQLKALTGLLTVSCLTRPGFQVGIAFAPVKAVHSLSDDECPDHSVLPDLNSRKLPCSPDWLTSHRERHWEDWQKKATTLSFSNRRAKTIRAGKLCKKIWMSDNAVFQSVVAIRIFLKLNRRKISECITLVRAFFCRNFALTV